MSISAIVTNKTSFIGAHPDRRIGMYIELNMPESYRQFFNGQCDGFIYAAFGSKRHFQEWLLTH